VGKGWVGQGKREMVGPKRKCDPAKSWGGDQREKKIEVWGGGGRGREGGNKKWEGRKQETKFLG